MATQDQLDTYSSQVLQFYLAEVNFLGASSIFVGKGHSSGAGVGTQKRCEYEHIQALCEHRRCKTFLNFVKRKLISTEGLLFKPHFSSLGISDVRAQCFVANKSPPSLHECITIVGRDNPTHLNR